jgi:hypothetical protein
MVDAYGRNSARIRLKEQKSRITDTADMQEPG